MHTHPFRCRSACIVFLFIASWNLIAAQSRVDRIINTGWKFSRENAPGAARIACSEDRWEKVSLPHTWNAGDGQDGGNDYYRGVGWYRAHLKLPSGWRGRSLFLKFDGAATVTQVYVNERLAGTHRGNFGAFCFDISPFVRFDRRNVIAVRVSNARDPAVAPLQGDFTVFGGLYRSVHLLALNGLSVSPLDDASPGIYLKQSHVTDGAADLEITTVVRNAFATERHATVRCVITDREGHTVATADTSTVVPPSSQHGVVQHVWLRTPHLWQGRKDPYCYQTAIEIIEGGGVTDRVVQPLGLRFFSVDPEKGFFLNGTALRLQGVNRHQDRLNKGWAIGIGEHREDFRLIEEMGCTAVRLAHYQHAQEFYDLCDRGGIVVWAELALVDAISLSPDFAACCRDQLRELIKQNFNHPSILFWSMGNELIPDPYPEPCRNLITDLNALAHQLDPTRLTTIASRSTYNWSDPINTITDLIGYNVYKGWYEGKPEDFALYVDTLHSRLPQRPFCISEFGAGAGISQHGEPPRRPDPGGPWHPEEWQAKLHEITWKAMAQRPFLWGTFIWNMFDFASDGRSEGELPGRNDKGLVTYDRKTKKDAFFWYKANWNPEPMVHITGKRYTPRPAGDAGVKVYANCDSVSLFINGRPVGSRTARDRIFVWSGLDLREGKTTVEAVGVSGLRRIRDSCTWWVR